MPRDPDTAAIVRPSNTEAEQGLLGAILVNNIAYSRVAPFLTAEHFANGVHGRIYQAIATLIERGHVADPITLRAAFEQDSAFSEIDGFRYLVKLVESAVTVINAEYYGRTVFDLYLRRRLIEAAQETIDAVRRDALNDSAQDIAGRLEIRLASLTETRDAEPSLVSAGQAAQRALDTASSAARGGPTGAVPIGIASLDRLIGGWRPGEPTYIGKRPSMGGTAFCVTIALNAARMGIPTIFFSLEMNAEQIGRRALSQLTGFSDRRLREGQFDGADWETIINAQARLAGWPLVIEDDPYLTTGLLRLRCREAARKGKLGFVVIDYLQLLRPGGPKTMEMRESVAAVSASLRLLARDLKTVPVVSIVQLGRGPEERDDKRPHLADLKYSSDLDQDAGTVAMIYREEYYLRQAEPRGGPNEDPLKTDKRHAQWSAALEAARGTAEIICVKNRSDNVGSAEIAFDGLRSLFYDPDEPALV